MIRVWQRVMIGAGMFVALFSSPGRANDFRTFTIDLSRHEVSLHWKNVQGQSYRSLGAVKKELETSGHRVLALMNAGIYDKKYRPLGLHISAGKEVRRLDMRRGDGNFYFKPNGVFAIGKKGASITRTSQFKPGKDLVLATQSGPLLFDHKGLHRGFVKSSRHRNFRNGVGVRKDGEIILVMSTKPVTFWQLAVFLRDEQKCVTGLYLDGAISQFWRQGEKEPRAYAPFVGILAVTERKKD